MCPTIQRDTICKGLTCDRFRAGCGGQLLRGVVSPYLLVVFIPSSPTPFTGYTITIPRADIIELPISVEEAIGFAVSGGVLRPDHQKMHTMTSSPPLHGADSVAQNQIDNSTGHQESEGH